MVGLVFFDVWQLDRKATLGALAHVTLWDLASINSCSQTGDALFAWPIPQDPSNRYVSFFSSMFQGCHGTGARWGSGAVTRARYHACGAGLRRSVAGNERYVPSFHLHE